MFFTKIDKIIKQQGGRLWTDSDIQEVLDNPALTLPAVDYANRGTANEKATVYYRSDGHYVIRNDNTGEVFQVSDRNNPNWYDEHRKVTVRPIP